MPLVAYGAEAHEFARIVNHSRLKRARQPVARDAFFLSSLLRRLAFQSD
jgi:hypothetical protein